MMRFVLLLVVLCGPALAFALPLCGAGKTDLSGQVQLLEDPGAALTLEQVQASNAFVTQQRLPIVREYGRAAYWLRLPISNHGA
ncbi:MAG: 7TM-DISM domain-containing protein, partial [Pseudomonas sp.]|uniref:7TMR-DISMED2 domain-containing protein n=1 Tax=Pseudomonas sp. TaxID=306 RepID=UPI0030F165A4